MTPTLTRAQSREFDQHACGVCGVPSLLLMENAGRGATDVILAQFTQVHRLLVVCGVGNNAGDGLVVARRWLALGRSVQVRFCAPTERLTGDARTQLDAYRGVGGLHQVVDGNWQQLAEDLAASELVVDALFGTGLQRDVAGDLAQVIRLMNACGKPIVALDLPSGLDADTGVTRGCCVRASLTVSFAFGKRGHFSTLAHSTVGTLHTVDIGVPSTLNGVSGQVAQRVDAPDVRRALSSRPQAHHKGQAGRVLVVGGARGTTGAARLSALGALRAGAGLATIATRSEVVAQLENSAWEVMVGQLSNDPIAGLDQLRAHFERVDAIVFGPGLGIDDCSERWVRCIVEEFNGTVVLDADGLSLFAGRARELSHARASLVLTPHPGEAARLLGCSTAHIEADRFESVVKLTEQSQAVVVLKGGPSLIAHRQQLWINDRGHPCLSTAGAGDVLAGVVAALACHLSAAEAAWCGSWLHAQAGSGWAGRAGTSSRGLLAHEIADELPGLIGRVLSAA